MLYKFIITNIQLNNIILAILNNIKARTEKINKG